MAAPTKRSLFFKGIILALIFGVIIRQYIRYRMAPDIDFSNIELVDVHGAPVDVAAYKGKAVFINFFATWCGPCHQEMPALEDMKNALGEENFVFIAISDEPPALIDGFRQKHNSGFLFAQSRVKREELGVHTIPTSYLIDREGKVVYEKVGVEAWNSESMLARLRELSGSN